MEADLTFSSRRSPVVSLHGCVASSQPLASNIGLGEYRKSSSKTLWINRLIINVNKWMTSVKKSFEIKPIIITKYSLVTLVGYQQSQETIILWIFFTCKMGQTAHGKNRELARHPPKEALRTSGSRERFLQPTASPGWHIHTACGQKVCTVFQHRMEKMPGDELVQGRWRGL